jgi:hypothetical protein
MSLVSTTGHYLGNILTPSELASTTDVLTTSTTGGVSSFQGMQSADDDSSSGGSTATISTTATLLSTLSSLETKDADIFKDATAEIAESLHEAAAETDDATSKYQLENLACRFSNASLTGSMSALNAGSQTRSLRGYGGTATNLFASYVTGKLDGDLCSEVNTAVRTSITSALAEREAAKTVQAAGGA